MSESYPSELIHAASSEDLNFEAHPCLTKIKANCLSIIEKYQHVLPSTKLNWQGCFLQKYNPFISYINKDTESFWAQTDLFEGLQAYWTLELTPSAYKYFLNLEEKTLMIMMIVELVMGTFKILKFENGVISIAPISCEKSNISSFIILEDTELLKPKIVMTKSGENELLDIYSINSKNSDGSPQRKLIEINQNSFNSWIKCNGEVFIPNSDIDEEISKIEQPAQEVEMIEKAVSENDEIEKIMEVVDKDSSWSEMNNESRIFENNIMQEEEKNIQRNIDLAAVNLGHHNIKETIDTVEVTNTNENQDVEIKETKEPISISDIEYQKMREELERVQQEGNINEPRLNLEEISRVISSNEIVSIQNNCEFMLKEIDHKVIQENEITDWTDFLLFWHNQSLRLELYPGLEEIWPYFGIEGIVWTIDIELEILNHLKALAVELRIVYFYKIIKLSQGFVFDNIELFYQLNENTKDWIILYVYLDEFLQEPFYCILCVDEINDRILFKMKVAGLLEINNPKKKIDAYVNKIRRNPKMCKNLKSICGQNDLRTFTLIEENKRIIPLREIRKSQWECYSTKIFALYDVGNPTDNYIQILFIKDQKQETSDFINLEPLTSVNEIADLNQKAAIFYLEKIQNQTNYQFQLRLYESKTISYAFFYESTKTAKKLGNSPFRFLFNIKFMQNSANYFYKQPICKPVTSLYEHYMHYFFQLAISDNCDGFPYLIKQFKEIAGSPDIDKEGQIMLLKKIDNYICKFFQESIKIELLYAIICTFGLVNINYFKEICLKSLQLILINIPSDFYSFIKEYSQYDTYIEFKNGLQKLFILCEKDQIYLIYEIIQKIKDYNFLYLILIDILKQLENWKMSFGLIGISFIKAWHPIFYRTQQIKLMNSLYPCVRDTNELFSLLYESSLFIDPQVIKKTLHNFFFTKEALPAEIHTILIQISNLPESLLKHFNKQDINYFLKKNLQNAKNIKVENLELYSSIYNLCLEVPYLGKMFDLSIFENTINILGFAESLPLIQFVPEKLSDLYIKWLIRITNGLKADIEKIDNELLKLKDLGNKLSKLSIEFLLNKYDHYEIIKLIDICKYKELKIDFKEAFLEIVINNNRFEQEAKKLSNLQDNIKYNKLLRELTENVCQYCKPPVEDLMEHLIIHPNKKYFLYKYIKKKNNNQPTVAWECLCKFIKKFIKTLKNKSVLMNTLLEISKHTESQTKIFSSCYKAVLNKNNLKPTVKIEHLLTESLEEFKKIDRDVELISKIFFYFCQPDNALSPLQQPFDEFKNSYLQMQLNKAKIPNVLTPLKLLVRKAPYAIDSILFRANLMEFRPECLLNLDSFSQDFIDIEQRTVNDVKHILSNLNNFKLADIQKISQLIKKDELGEEVAILTKLTNHDQEELNLFQSVLYWIDFDNAYSVIWKIYEFKQLLKLDSDIMLDLCERWVESRRNLSLYEYEKNMTELCTNLMPAGQVDYDQVIFLLSEIYESEELIKFLNSIGQEELDFLQDGFDTGGPEKIITAELIAKFSNTWNFFALLRNFHGNLSEYFLFMIERMKSEKYSNVAECMKLCRDHLNDIISFNYNLNNQEQARLKRIKQIYHCSTYRIIKQPKVKFSVELYIMNEEGYEMNPLGLLELIELKDRAHLSKYIINDKNSGDDDRSKDLEIYEKFICLVDVIINSIERLKIINNSLYRSLINLNYEFNCTEGEIKTSKEYYDYYAFYCDKWKRLINSAITQNVYLNFLYKKRICIIRDYVFSNQEKNFIMAVPLVKFMRKIPMRNLNPLDPPEDIEVQLSIISAFIEGLDFNNNSVEFLTRYPKKIIEQSQRTILICDSNKFYQGILSIYYNTERQVPKIDEVFFCHFNTDWLELKIFLNRCFFNSYSLYTLVLPEELSLENQTKAKSKILKFFRNYRDLNFNLGLVTNDLRSNLVNYFRNQKEINIIKIPTYKLINEKELNEITEAIASEIIVVTSEFVGLGKTTYIKEEIKHSGREHIEVNISGNLTAESIGKTLKKYQKSLPVAYHFQLSYIEDTAAIHEFLFSIAIFKQHYSSKTLFYIPEDSVIYIEVANTYKNSLFKSLHFLEMLKIKHINSFTILNLLPSEEIDYICTYLYYYKQGQIDGVDLNFQQETYKSLQIHTKRELIQNFFTKNSSNPTYHQFKTFVSVLSTLLKNFENGSFSVEVIKWQSQDFPDLAPIFASLRSSLIKSMLDTTKEFTEKCVDSVKSSQTSALERISEKPLPDETSQDFTKSLKWENSNHFTMLFLEQGDFLCIYRDPEIVPVEYKQFLNIQSYLEKNTADIQGFRQRAFEEMGTAIENYNDFDSYQLIDKLITFYIKFSLRKARKARLDNIERGTKHDDLYALKESRLIELFNSGYVLTPDNFLKMNLIYLRCIAGVPIFIMGETGCGKTSLIRFFVKEILQESLEIFCIHTGITSDQIYEKMKEFNTKASSFKLDRFWVFFDEFNTSDCVGMICDIICDKKVRDLTLSPNLVFVGACNPYRVKAKIKECEVGIKSWRNRKENNTSQLVHIVKPLPDKAIEYVWDFGTLKADEIKSYISSMIADLELNDKELFLILLCAAHEFFQIREDFSSVSLRDIRRFIILYKWFEESISARSKHPSSKFCDEIDQFLYDSGISEENSQLIAGILAFFHCYFLRISSEEQRNDFHDLIKKKCNENGLMEITCEMTLNLIKAEQYDLISRMSIPEGTAYNSALLENIFAIIPCVLNKIPIIICGKPGCSKSLAIQIITSSIRGDKSTDEYFKTLPELQMISFQGSDTCTSEGITEVFNRAKKFLKNKHILPVVVFDEIGLAEISKHNPLKVLHELLEYENCDVGFIGISNWRLDSSKMNRTLFLARPDPDESDVVDTAVTVYQSISPIIDDEHMLIIRSLAMAYYQLKRCFKENDFCDFYGLRDFYHMIKYASNKLKSNPSSEKFLEIANMAIFRNFGGKIQGAQLLINWFIDFYKPKPLPVLSAPEVKAMIKDNLLSEDSRYLMIICNKNVSMYLIEGMLKTYAENPKIIRGSSFENDVSKDDLSFKILSDIIRYMEQGFTIILQDMEAIYSSLYDLFNQNFTKFSNANKKYCRVALGAQFNPRCFVHDKFKAIVFLDDSDESLKQTDAPFLNRFEKHHVTIADIFSPGVKHIEKIISNWIDTLINFKENKLSLNSILPLYSKEALNLLSCFLSENLSEEEIFMYSEELVRKNKEFWIDTATVDLVLLCEINEADQEEKRNSIEMWKILKSITFFDYIQEILQKGQKKAIIITYDSQDIDSEIQSKFQYVYLQKCCNFRSENEVNGDLKRFYQSNYQLYLLEVDFVKEEKHLRQIVDLIKDIESRPEHKKKSVCILVRMSRNDTKRQPLSLFHGWNYKVFEHLLNSELSFLEDINTFSFIDIISKKDLIDWNLEWPEVIQNSIDTLKYHSVVCSYNEIFNYKLQLAQVIIESFEVRNMFWQKIAESQNTITRNLFIKRLFSDERLTSDSKSAKDALRIFIKTLFFDQLTKLLVFCERKAALNSLFYLNNDNFMELWRSSIQNFSLKQTQVQLKYESNLIPFIKDLRTPFVFDDFTKLKALYKELLNSNESRTVDPQLFMESHKKNSSLKELILYYYEYTELQQSYIDDLIKIILNEATCDYRYLEIIAAVVKKMITESTFEKRLIRLIDFQSKVVILHKILEVYQGIRREEPYWIIGVVNIEPNEMIIEEKLENVKSENESCEESEEESDDMNLDSDESEESEEVKAANPNFDRSIKLQLSNVFEIIIQNISPTQETLPDLIKIDSYIISIQTIQDLVESFNQGLDLPNFSLEQLDFCVKLCQLKPKHATLLRLCNQAMTHNKDFLSNKEFSREILSFLKNSNDINVKKFKIFYFDILLESSEDYLDLIKEEINSDTNLWTYSSTLIQKIIELSGIEALIKRHERSPSSFTFIKEKPKNANLLKLCELLEYSELDSKFSLILCDKFTMMFSLSNLHLPLQKIQEACKFYIGFLNNPVGDYQKLTIIVCISRLKVFLQQYSEVLLLEEDEKAVKEADFLLDMNVVLSGCESLTYELYCFKSIKEKLLCRIPKLVQTLIKLESSKIAKWRHNVLDIDIGTGISIFPLIPTDLEKYRNISLNLLGVVDDVDALDQVINEASTLPDIKLFLALAVLNNIFLGYKLEEFNFEPFKFWVLQKSELIKTSLTPIFLLFIQQLIHNFPQDSVLHLTSSASTSSLAELESILFIIAITLSYNTIQNPISSLFFKSNGEIHQNLNEIFNTRFFIGAAPEKIHDYLLYVLKNFNVLKSTTFDQGYSRGGSYVCSNTCDYLYFINDCGGAIERKPCPFCGSEIGGEDHNAVNRAGHRNLTDADALIFLQDKVDFYRNREACGFDISGNNTPITVVRSLEQKITFNLLNIIPNAIFYWMIISEIASTQSLAGMFEIEEFRIKQQIESNLKDNFKEINSMTMSNEPYYWNLSCISMLQGLILENQSSTERKSIRDNFEQQFESKIFEVCQLEAINQYKTLINKFNKPSALIKYIEELDIPDEIIYKYGLLFKITKNPSFDSMSKSFNFSSRKSELKPLGIIIENYSELVNLSQFWPILKFSKHLMSILNSNISRDEACKIPIKSIIPEYKLGPMFKRFKKAWEKLNIKLVNGCKTFEKIELTADTTIAHFLIDTDLNSLGCYITAALISLGNIQNRFLKLCRDDVEALQTNYPIQALQQSDIIKLSTDLDELSEACSIQSYKYSLGKEIFYDFDRIQMSLLRDLRKAKYVNLDDLNSIQYQFELLNTRGKHAGVVCEIRNLISQEPMDVACAQNYENEINGRDTSKSLKLYCDIYKWLEKALCRLSHMKITENSELLVLEQQDKRSNLKDFSIQEWSFAHLNLKYIISFFEFIELKCYPKVATTIGEQYKCQLSSSEATKDEFTQFFYMLNESHKIRIDKELCNVLKRIIIRILTANVDEKFDIDVYLDNESYWSKEYIGFIEEVVGMFPRGYKLSDAFYLEQLLSEITQDEKIMVKREIKKSEKKKSKLKKNKNSSKVKKY